MQGLNHGQKDRKAEVGKQYGIGVSAHGLGAFHPVGTGVSECVACVQDGATIRLTGISGRLQRKHHLRAEEVGTFVDNGHNCQDFIDFGGKVIPLRTFAYRGVTMSVMPAIPIASTYPIEAAEKAAPQQRELVAA